MKARRAEEEKEEKTQINVKLSKGLLKRLWYFMAEAECNYYWQAIQLLLDMAEKNCVRVRRCACVEATMEEL
jgi:3-methyladenine DNA glycosylase Tag